MKKSCKKLFLIVIFIAITTLSFAQGPPPPPPPPGLPVDGGIIFLLASGIVYGVAKLREKE